MCRALLVLCGTLLVVLPIALHGECLSGSEDAARTPVSKLARKNLYAGEQTFMLNMLAAINRTAPHENVFFSPYSTYHALLLAYFGAQGQTERELHGALHLGWATSKFEVYQAYRFEKMQRKKRFADNAAVTFRSVDKVFVSKPGATDESDTYVCGTRNASRHQRRTNMFCVRV